MTTTDTPRTDACHHCGAEYFDAVQWKCGTTPIIDGDTHRSPLCKEREARQKAEAKVQELDSLLTYSLQHSEKFREWAQAEVGRLRAIVAQLIHYPDCWDTACYETMDDALHEIGDFKFFECTCDECPNRPTSVSQEDIWEKCGLSEPTEPMNECNHDVNGWCHACSKLKEPVAEWRELGPDEIIQDGDEFSSHSYVKWRPIDDELHNTMVKQWASYCYRFRTRRPLPPVVDQTQSKEA